MTQTEFFDESKYFESDSKKLKTEYLLHYHSTPHWSSIPRIIDIFIDENYSVEVKLFWREPSIGKRLFSFYQSNLIPQNIKQLLKNFISLDKAELKTLYTSKEEKYSPEGISEDYYHFNHPSNSFYISMSSHWTNEKLFQSQEEVLFLSLHKALDIWKDELYQGIINLYK